MKTKFGHVLALSLALTLSVLIVSGCGGGAQERAVFAQNMTEPAEGLTASTSGTENEILVIQLLRTTPSDSEILIREKRLTYLRSKGFKRVEVRGSDGNIMWEKTLD
jgi:hypothetical protein